MLDKIQAKGFGFWVRKGVVNVRIFSGLSALQQEWIS